MSKVLYVDDNDDNVYMLKMRLELLGDFEVITAEDGEKGREMVCTERPDIVLMDLEMPGISGWEAAKRIKSNPETLRHPRVSVIGARPRWRAREGTRCGLRRIRYQTGRIRSTGREAAAAASQQN